MTQYISIGKAVAAFGVQGDLVVQHHLGKKTALKGLETIFIEQAKEEMLPYFIESVKARTPVELQIKLEGVDSREQAQKLVQKQIWLTEDAFRQYSAKTTPISMLGYHIIDEGNDLGEVLEVIEQPHQLLCRIDLQGKEALIPIHEETLLKIDKKNKLVLVQLPEGLLDIFR